MSNLIVIRPMIETDVDYGHYARLQNYHSNELSTIETVRDEDVRFPPDGYMWREFAEIEGKVIGLAGLYRFPNDKVGVVWVHVIVEPESRGKGVGRVLCRDLLDQCEAKGFTEVRGFVRDEDSDSRDFASRRGFTTRQHIFESTIQLDQFDLDADAQADPLGIDIIRFEDVKEEPGAMQKLCHIHNLIDADIPGVDGEHRTVEQFEHEMTSSYLWDPTTIFIAVADGRWIGLGWVHQTHPGKYFNTITGVSPEFRGRGIAQALKLRTIRLAKERGGTYIRTNNDSKNAPMLAINRKLGYKPEPGWFILERIERITLPKGETRE